VAAAWRGSRPGQLKELTATTEARKPDIAGLYIT
jgi:hypothetical protein